ncbi:hypothetical protein M5689_000984 [Euphorbia peplus]|nr:hypothetical protein M5689_000984 [Euphorbia peplus]
MQNSNSSWQTAKRQELLEDSTTRGEVRFWKSKLKELKLMLRFSTTRLIELDTTSVRLSQRKIVEVLAKVCQVSSTWMEMHEPPAVGVVLKPEATVHGTAVEAAAAVHSIVVVKATTTAAH